MKIWVSHRKLAIVIVVYLDADTTNLDFNQIQCIFHTIDKKICISSLLTNFHPLPFQAITVFIAAALPNIGPFVTLIGAVCLSTLGMMFPAVIELVTFYEKPGYGRFNWILWKNIFLILFGVVGFITGTYVSIEEFSQHLEEV